MKSNLRILRISEWTAIGVILLLTAGSAQSQTDPVNRLNQRPTLGGTAGVIVPSSPLGSYAPHHHTPNGQNCIKIGGAALPFATDANLYNHWIYTENQCQKNIRLQVCYYSTTSCIDMNVPGNGRKDAILGTLPSIKDFRYEYRERF